MGKNQASLRPVDIFPNKREVRLNKVVRLDIMVLIPPPHDLKDRSLLLKLYTNPGSLKYRCAKLNPSLNVDTVFLLDT